MGLAIILPTKLKLKYKEDKITNASLTKNVKLKNIKAPLL